MNATIEIESTVENSPAVDWLAANALRLPEGVAEMLQSLPAMLAAAGLGNAKARR